MGLLLETAAAFVGTIAFGILFVVPSSQFLVCCLVGGIGWVVYAVTLANSSAAVASFMATVVIVLLARILAVVRKVPTNVIMIPGIFPIVPGIGLYDMIYNLMIGDTASGVSQGLAVLKAIGAIVFGIIAVFSLPNRWFRKRPKIVARR